MECSCFSDGWWRQMQGSKAGSKRIVAQRLMPLWHLQELRYPLSIPESNAVEGSATG
jgi:hypothetical protein